MKRIYHHYLAREECAKAGMWRNVSQRERESFTLVAAELMAFPERFERAMIRVLDEWPNSCEAALTAASMNQLAWLGHAGTFLATGSPEDATRLGWHRLNGLQQNAANAAAQRVVFEWRRRRRLHLMAGQLSMFEGELSA